MMGKQLSSVTLLDWNGDKKRSETLHTGSFNKKKRKVNKLTLLQTLMSNAHTHTHTPSLGLSVSVGWMHTLPL